MRKGSRKVDWDYSLPLSTLLHGGTNFRIFMIYHLVFKGVEKLDILKIHFCGNFE